MKHALVLISLLLIGHAAKTDTSKIVQKCENTFVLSGYGNQIMLFEHKDNSTKFNLLKIYHQGNNAFYDCKRNIIIALQNKKRRLKEGILIYNISNNSQKLYETNSGFNGIIAKYKDGFIYSTSKTKLNKVNNNQFGYIPKNKIFSKSLILNSKNNELWYHYTEDRFFDLNKRSVIKTYPFGMWKISEIINHDLYVYAGDFLKINLINKKATNLWSIDHHMLKQNTKELKLPKARVGLFVNGVYFIITSSKSWDTVTNRNNTKAVKFKKGAIYQIKNQKLSFTTLLPFDDIVYANSPDKKYLYIFTKSRKVIKYNIKKNKIVQIYKLNIHLDQKFELATVGFTDDNFIISFEEDRYRNAYIVLANKNFTHFSKPYNIRMGGIDIATQQSIHTNHMRVNNL
ncbi:MAG: hypothetical protein LGB55_03245 [Sulfurovum sp.]|nr:hypothetical protein [Sulfurovum sp.]